MAGVPNLFGAEGHIDPWSAVWELHIKARMQKNALFIFENTHFRDLGRDYKFFCIILGDPLEQQKGKKLITFKTNLKLTNFAGSWGPPKTPWGTYAVC